MIRKRHEPHCYGNSTVTQSKNSNLCSLVLWQDHRLISLIIFFKQKPQTGPAFYYEYHPDGETFLNQPPTTPESLDPLLRWWLKLYPMVVPSHHGSSLQLKPILKRAYGLTLMWGSSSISAPTIGPINRLGRLLTTSDFWWCTAELFVVNSAWTIFVLAEQVANYDHDFSMDQTANSIQQSQAFSWNTSESWLPTISSWLVASIKKMPLLLAWGLPTTRSSLEDIRWYCPDTSAGAWRFWPSQTVPAGFVDYVHNGDSLASAAVRRSRASKRTDCFLVLELLAIREKVDARIISTQPASWNQSHLTADDPNREDPIAIAKRNCLAISFEGDDWSRRSYQKSLPAWLVLKAMPSSWLAREQMPTKSSMTKGSLS